VTTVSQRSSRRAAGQRNLRGGHPRR
jgi:hypothetical protein